MNHLEVINLTKIFKNGTGIKSASFYFNEGEVVGFVGKNGSGKTTTIRTILGDYIKFSGDILYNGNKISKNDYSEIAFFPDHSNFPNHFNVIEYAEYSAKLSRIPKEQYEPIIKSLVKQLKMEKYIKNRFSELSSGWQKKALLLSVLITNPKLIIFDEPTANLDVQSRISFLETIKQLSENNHITIFIASHVIEELQQIVNRVVIIDDGHILFNENIDNNIFDLKKKYLEMTNLESDVITLDLKIRGSIHEKNV